MASFIVSPGFVLGPHHHQPRGRPYRQPSFFAEFEQEHSDDDEPDYFYDQQQQQTSCRGGACGPSYTQSHRHRRPGPQDLARLHRESLRREAQRQEALRLEALRQEALRQEALRQEALRQEALRQEALRQEALRLEAVRREAQRQEALRREAVRRAQHRRELEEQQQISLLEQELLRQQRYHQHQRQQQQRRHPQRRHQAEYAHRPLGPSFIRQPQDDFVVQDRGDSEDERVEALREYYGRVLDFQQRRQQQQQQQQQRQRAEALQLAAEKQARADARAPAADSWSESQRQQRDDVKDAAEWIVRDLFGIQPSVQTRQPQPQPQQQPRSIPVVEKVAVAAPSHPAPATPSPTPSSSGSTSSVTPASALGILSRFARKWRLHSRLHVLTHLSSLSRSASDLVRSSRPSTEKEFRARQEAAMRLLEKLDATRSLGAPELRDVRRRIARRVEKMLQRWDDDSDRVSQSSSSSASAVDASDMEGVRALFDEPVESASLSEAEPAVQEPASDSSMEIVPDATLPASTVHSAPVEVPASPVQELASAVGSAESEPETDSGMEIAPDAALPTPADYSAPIEVPVSPAVQEQANPVDEFAATPASIGTEDLAVDENPVPGRPATPILDASIPLAEGSSKDDAGDGDWVMQLDSGSESNDAV